MAHHTYPPQDIPPPLSRLVSLPLSFRLTQPPGVRATGTAELEAGSIGDLDDGMADHLALGAEEDLRGGLAAGAEGSEKTTASRRACTTMMKAEPGRDLSTGNH